jgi:hypothetical protein
VGVLEQINKQLELLMWFEISNKLKRSVEDSKVIILDIYSRYQSNISFNLNDYDSTVIDSFIFFVESKKNIDFD